MSNGISVIALGQVERDDLAALRGDVELLASELPPDAAAIDHAEALNNLLMHAANDWLLLMRQGERITPAVAAEIAGATASSRAWGYRIAVTRWFAGKPLRLPRDAGEIRLVHRRHARFRPDPGAREMFVQGTVIRFRASLWRATYRSVEEHESHLARSHTKRSLAAATRHFLRRVAREGLLFSGWTTLRFVWTEERYAAQAIAATAADR